MHRRDRLIQRMQAVPHDIRFAEVEQLLRQEGFVPFNRRGSHCSYHRADGKVLTIVRPHGRHKTCHRTDIRNLLEVLRL